MIRIFTYLEIGNTRGLFVEITAFKPFAINNTLCLIW